MSRAERFAVIGLGRFGARIAGNLAAARQEVIAIDLDPRRVEAMRDQVTLAVSLDATDEEALRLQGIQDVDVAIVAIGHAFEASALATVVLRDLGVPRVVARSATSVSAEILRRIGATDVVNPEDESADRWTVRLTSPHFLVQHELEPGFSLVELRVPKAWHGRTLAQLQLRQVHQLHVVALRRPAQLATHAEGEDEEAQSRAVRLTRAPIRLPMPHEPLEPTDTLVLMGRDQDLAKLAAANGD